VLNKLTRFRVYITRVIFEYRHNSKIFEFAGPDRPFLPVKNLKRSQKRETAFISAQYQNDPDKIMRLVISDDFGQK